MASDLQQAIVAQSTVPTILDNNEFFKDLLSLVNTAAFQTFYKKHMNGSGDIKSSLVYIELYNTINEMHQSMMGHAISPENAAEIMQLIMKKGEYRRPLIHIVSNYIESGSERSQLQTKIQHSLLSLDSLALDDARHDAAEQATTQDDATANYTVQDVGRQ